MKKILDVEVKSCHLMECLDRFNRTPFATALEDSLKIRDDFFFCVEYENSVQFWKGRKNIYANYLTMKGIYNCFYKFVKEYNSIRKHKPPDIEDILDMGDKYRLDKFIYPFSFKAEVEM